MAEYDTLYLQRQEHITGLPIVQPWRVNEDDIEYIPATSSRVAQMKQYECIDRLNCRYSDCRFHVICCKYHRARDAERVAMTDAYTDRLDDENARLLKVRGM